MGRPKRGIDYKEMILKRPFEVCSASVICILANVMSLFLSLCLRKRDYEKVVKTGGWSF